MFDSIPRTIMIGLAAGALLLTSLPRPTLAGSPDIPAPGQSKKVDEIKARGTLKVAAIGEFPWLPENTSGSGPQFSGSAWMLAEAFASRLGVKLEVVPVSHETKVSSDEMAAPVGMAIDKNEPLFLEWLRAVAAEMKDATDAEELRIMKSVTG